MTQWELMQEKAVEKVLTAFGQGVRRICLSGPPGIGKTRTAAKIIRDFLDRSKRVAFYTNSRMILDQSTKNFAGFDLEHGVRAAGHKPQGWHKFQVCSIQTETQRMKGKDYELHNCDLAVVDELHLNGGPSVQTILSHHVNAGAVALGLTATPVDLGHIADVLIEACTVSQAREIGALVPIEYYGVDEPDLRAMKLSLAAGEDVPESKQKKAIMTKTVFGRVWDWWVKLNPEMRPTLGFGPGKAESLWFAREFWRRGVSTAHIDGDEVVLNGEHEVTSPAARDDILASHKAGDIKIIWCYKVLREGVDMPWAEFLLLASMIGSVASFIQMVGRIQRSSAGKQYGTVIDFGGNWWRHGDPNADREWHLEYDSRMYGGLREEMLRKHPERMPIRCPECAAIITTRFCTCGFIPKKVTYPRPVVQLDGTIKMLSGSPYKARRIDTRDGAESNWKKLFWGYRKSQRIDKTFRELIAYYQTQNNWKYPDPSWAFYPKETIDQFRKVKSVPFDRLNQDRSKS